MRRIAVLIVTFLWLMVMPRAIQGHETQAAYATVFSPNDLSPLAENPVKSHPKMESALYKVAMLGSKADWNEVERYAGKRGLPLKDRRIRVVLESKPGERTPLVSAARDMGLRVEATHQNRVQALVPVVLLLDVADQASERFVRLPYQAVPLSVTSEGVAIIGADAWQSGGHGGGGVKVAVFDKGFQDYPSLIANGELPASVVVHSFRSDGDIAAGEIHGTACAEIVYDIAPDAQLYLINFDTDVEFGNAVDYAIAQGVQVVSCSLGWLDAGPFDGSGPICDIVNHGRNNGIFWAQSAGDSANKHWEGPWSDPDSDNVHNFAGDDQGQSITVSANRTISANLVWDDPWGASGNDYDLYLYNSDDQPVASSQDVQDGDDRPSEFISYDVGPTGAGAYYLTIEKNPASSPAFLELYSPQEVFEHQVSASSLLIPADAGGAVAAGAVYWATDGLEGFSSRGPTNDGRLGPEFTAPDGVSSVTYAGGFYGTSAAAAHLAGAAALVRDAYPSYSVTDTVTFLAQRAVDLGTDGHDNQYGYGRLSLGPPPSLPNRGPQVGTVTPSDGSCALGKTQWFTTTWSDPDGWQDLKQCYFHIGAAPNLASNVTLLYNAQKDKLWIRSNDGTGWLGGFAPGSFNTLRNDQAQVYCAQTTVQGSGDILSVRWAISFKETFTGTKKTYLKCKDVHGARGKGEEKGSWTITEGPAATLVIGHITDAHIGLGWIESQRLPLVVSTLSPEAEVMVDTGDCTDHGTAAECVEYLDLVTSSATIPWRSVMGPHDAPHTFEAHIGPLEWSWDVGGYRLIGINTEAINFTALDQALTTEKPCIIFGHFPLEYCSPGDQSKLRQRFLAYDIPIYVSGHAHRNSQQTEPDSGTVLLIGQRTVRCHYRLITVRGFEVENVEFKMACQ
jgi:hypothetical protein